jgi:hypothetical protein
LRILPPKTTEKVFNGKFFFLARVQKTLKCDASPLTGIVHNGDPFSRVHPMDMLGVSKRYVTCETAEKDAFACEFRTRSKFRMCNRIKEIDSKAERAAHL